MNLAEKLCRDGLRRVGYIKRNGEVLVATVTDCACNWSSGVYVWVALDEEERPLRVKYVGRHSKLLATRCSQHSSGFRRSKTGKKNARNILDELARGVKYFGIYGMWSSQPRVKEVDLMRRYYGDDHKVLWNVSGMNKIGRELGFL